jgi:hypothetical protein
MLYMSTNVPPQLLRVNEEQGDFFSDSKRSEK